MFIIASIGPSSMNRYTLEEIINSGAHTLRLNFSHNRCDDFKFVVDTARQISNDIHIMQDLCGSKIRVSKKLLKTFKVYKGQKVVFCSEENYKNNNSSNEKEVIIPITVSQEKLIKIDNKFITMKDNTMIFNVDSIEKGNILCTTKKGGVIRADKGCNIKNIDRNSMCLSQKDKEDIKWGYKNKVDIISQSYVESAEDIENLRKYTKNFENFNPKIYAKIETKKGIINILDIANACDGIIIARGDLLPETSLYEVPFYEDYVVRKLIDKKINLIFATHVLDSMIKEPSPNLSEIESIYNIIKSRVDGILLAGETSVGKYPGKSVKILKTLINKYQNEK